MVSSRRFQAYEKIGTVSTMLGIPQHVLRFWEARFPEVRPLRRGAAEHAKRFYRPEDIALLNGIRYLLHAKGYSIRGVQRILKEQGAEAVRNAVPASELADF